MNDDWTESGDEEDKVSTGGGIGFGWEEASWHSTPSGYIPADSETGALVDDSSALAEARHKPQPPATCLHCKAHATDLEGGADALVPVGEPREVAGRDDAVREHICAGCLRSLREFKREVGPGKRRAFRVFVDSAALEDMESEPDPAAAVAEELNEHMSGDARGEFHSDGTTRRPDVTAWRGGSR